MKVKIKGIHLTDSQRQAYEAAHNENYKYLTLVWSRQSGKSTLMEILCIEWLLMKSEEIIYFTPTYLLAKRFYNKIIKLIPEDLLVKSNSSELIIETITGSILKFYSGEAAQTARGSNCTRLIVDEAAYIKDEIDGQSFWYNIVLPLLKIRGKTAILISTPFSKSGFFYELCMKGLAGEKNFWYDKKTIYEDSLITKEEIEELKKGYPQLAWQCEFECQFMTSALSVFPDYEKCFKDNLRFDKSKVWGGIDLSTVGSDNTIVTFIDKNNSVIQFKIDGELDKKYEQIAKLLNDYKPVATYLEVNSIGEAMYNEIKKKLKDKEALKKWLTTNDSKKEMVNLVTVMITNDDIAFNSDNKMLYSELGTFSYSLTKSHNITYAAAGNAHDDTITSLGMAVKCKDDFKYTGKNNIYFIR